MILFIRGHISWLFKQFFYLAFFSKINVLKAVYWAATKENHKNIKLQTKIAFNINMEHNIELIGR